MADNKLAVIEQVVARGDLSKLSDGERVAYYGMVCDSVGLNPLTQPFSYLTLNGKLVLYANKGATDQLRSRDHISVTIVGTERQDDVYIVRARATAPDGRSDEEVGAVHIGGLRGDALANAFMKASTKAKRRVTLSICGLGVLDESEIETIPSAVKVTVEPETGEILASPPPPPNDAEVERGIAALLAELDAAGVNPGKLPDARAHREQWLITARERWARNPKNPANEAAQ